MTTYRCMQEWCKSRGRSGLGEFCLPLEAIVVCRLQLCAECTRNPQRIRPPFLVLQHYRNNFRVTGAQGHLSPALSPKGGEGDGGSRQAANDTAVFMAD